MNTTGVAKGSKNSTQSILKQNPSDARVAAELKVGDLPYSRPNSIHPDATIVEAVLQMKALDVDVLTICEDDQLVGMLTDRDVALRVVGGGLDPRTTSARAVMTMGVVTCYEDQNRDEAAQLLRVNHLHRMPVITRDNRLVGMVCWNDLEPTTKPE